MGVGALILLGIVLLVALAKLFVAAAPAAPAADPQSVPLVGTVLDRGFPDWRDAAGAGAETTRPKAGAMTRAEALHILGLQGEPSAEQVVEAHRRLMMAHHPDHGGSAYLAALINEAKTVLTGSR